MAKFNLTPALTSILAAIAATTAAGQTYFVGPEAKPLADNGYIEVNTEMKDTNGNVAARLTAKGQEAVPTSAPGNTTASTAPAVSFVISQVDMPPPAIKRGGGNTSARESKYPLDKIPLGRAAFLPYPGTDAEGLKKLSKQFGSIVAAYNKNHPDEYRTARTIEDGMAAGFTGVNPDGTPNSEAFAGIPGIAIYHRPLSEKKPRKSRKADQAEAA